MNQKSVKFAVFYVVLVVSTAAMSQIAELSGVESPAAKDLNKTLVELRKAASEVGYLDAFLLMDEVALSRKGGLRPDEDVTHLLGKKHRKEIEKNRATQQGKVTSILKSFESKNHMCNRAVNNYYTDKRGMSFARTLTDAARSLSSTVSEQQSIKALVDLGSAHRTGGQQDELVQEVHRRCL